MDKKIKNSIKTVLFLSLVIIMFQLIGAWLWFDAPGGGGGFRRMYDLPSETVDVMAFGSSHAHCSVDHGTLWKEYGIAGFTFSAGDQSMDGTAAFVKQALRYRKPKVLLVEMYGVTADHIVNDDTTIGRNLLGMKWSPLYLEYAGQIIRSYPDISFDKAFEVVTKIPLIHARYGDVKWSDLQLRQPYLMGYRGSIECDQFDTPTVSEWNRNIPLAEEVVDCLDDIVLCAEKSDVELVFWIAPYCVSAEEQGRYNALAEYASKHNVPCIDFNRMYDELGIDFETDFRDPGHLNNSGAKKVTSYLAQYVKEHYDLVDHRGDERYAQWVDNALYLEYKADGYEVAYNRELEEYLLELAERENRHSIGIIFNGYYDALPTYNEGMIRLGITREEYESGESILLRPGDEGWDRVRNGSLGDRSDALFTIDESTYSIPENGMLVYEYDEDLEVLMDIVAVDVINIGTEIRVCEPME